MKGNRNAADITRIALCVAALCASSYVVFPLPFTPVVLSIHTIVVNLIALTLRPGQAACAMGVYLLMGLVGLPVLSGGTGGAGKLFGPTGGFYFGFLAAAVVISLLKGREIRMGRYVLVTIAAGIPIQHLMAVLFMCCHNGFNLPAAFLSVSLPFLLGDAAKCVVASAAGVAVNRALQRRGQG